MNIENIKCNSYILCIIKSGRFNLMNIRSLSNIFSNFYNPENIQLKIISNFLFFILCIILCIFNLKSNINNIQASICIYLYICVCIQRFFIIYIYVLPIFVSLILLIIKQIIFVTIIISLTRCAIDQIFITEHNDALPLMRQLQSEIHSEKYF